MTTTAYLGPPGTGKTYTLMKTVNEYLSRGVPSNRIGFVSFSKKATEEARTRAASELNLDYKNMPYFRTLHSLAFRQLNMKFEDVMRGSDYRKLEELLGLEFTSTSSLSINDGEFFRLGGKGDMYLSIYNMARVRGIDPVKQFHDTGNFSLFLDEFEHVIQAYQDYKLTMNKHDFTDMISTFVQYGEAPSLDLLIVDEAQDLVPLQWEMVDKLEASAQDVCYAGDDDQAIYEWMGVDPSQFIEKCQEADNRVLLDQSYRVPKRVHDYATAITDKITSRIPKKYNPKSEMGHVSYEYSLDSLDYSKEQWMILCRTNHIANKVSNQLKAMGLLFWRAGGGWSVSNKTISAVKQWTRLSRGNLLPREDFIKLYQLIKVDRSTRLRGNKLFKETDAEAFGIEMMSDMLGFDASDKHWYEVLTVSPTERVYITSVLESGEKFDEENPRIVLSTIHKAKGGEADNVALLLESTKACCTMGDRDGEKRVFYVGATRAKHCLYIIEPLDAKWKFEP